MFTGWNLQSAKEETSSRFRLSISYWKILVYKVLCAQLNFKPLSANPTKWSKHTQTIRQLLQSFGVDA